MKNRTDVIALLIAAMIALCITGLTIARQPSPEILSTIALVLLGIGGGVALPRGTSTETAAAALTAAAEVVPAVTPAPVVIPTQQTVVDQPVATHAPA